MNTANNSAGAIFTLFTMIAFVGCGGASAAEPAQMGCTNTYAVTQYECQNVSVADGYGPGGGEIFSICASTDAQTGEMTINARKADGSTFGDRPYQVRVSGASDGPCGPDNPAFFVSDADPAGIGTGQLTFEFPSVWQPGQTEKAYCVTASTQPGDPGYIHGNVPQQSWWYSEKALVTHECL